MLKKITEGLAALFVLGGAIFAVSVLKAEPIKDYAAISPTVKIESYRLSRGGDIYQPVQASATIISPSGLLLTNSHVVLDDDNDPYDAFAVCLTFNPDKEPVCEYTAQLKAYDKNLDLALLELNKSDNRGNLIPHMAYLPYENASGASIGDQVDVFGYPDTGGKTLTQTRGQLAGIETQNNINYLKSDADISSGNSGGTAIDQNGNFIGIPTFVRTSLENLGYILDITQAVDFINNHINDSAKTNEDALAKLKIKLNLFNDAKDKKSYSHPYYPQFNWSLTSGWEWDGIDNNSVTTVLKSNEGDKYLHLSVDMSPFKVLTKHIDEIKRIIALYTENLVDFKAEETQFAGVPATKLTYSAYDEKNVSYLIPYGNAIVRIRYSVKLEDYEKHSADYEAMLKTFSFTGKPAESTQVIDVLAKSSPAFSIGRAGNWFIQRSQHPSDEELIATWENPDSYYGQMKIYYRELEDDEKTLETSQILERIAIGFREYGSTKLVNKDASVVLDGLSGFSVTTMAPGQENETFNKSSFVFLRDQDHYYQITYTNLIDDYNAYLDDFKTVLRSFKNHNQPADKVGKGQYNLGSLDYAYYDVAFHRFEQSITKMVDKGIVDGYTDGSFRPEKTIMAAEVKRFAQKAVDDSRRPKADVSSLWHLPEGEISLGSAAQMLGTVFALDVWRNAKGDAPSYKPYLDKFYELEAIPTGLYDPNAKLTRAEFTYILDKLLSSLKVF